MTLDDRIYNFIARRVAMNATPSDRAIQLQFGLKNTDEALAAINRLRAAARITVEQVGHKRVIWCSAPVIDIEGNKPPVAPPDFIEPIDSRKRGNTRARQTLDPKKPKKPSRVGDIDQAFIAQVKQYLRDTGMHPVAFGERAMNDKQFVARRLDYPMYAETRVKVRAFMAAHPPLYACDAPDAVEVVTPPIITPHPVSSEFEADRRYEFALAMLADLEVNQCCKMKPRISAKVLAAQIKSGVPFDKFITTLINMGLDCWNEGALQ
jgi:hypothetical protein